MAINSSATIHPTSIVDVGARIKDNVKIGPFCCIGANVEIDEGTVIHSHVVINGITKIGKDNQIFQFASIGEINQDLKYNNEETETIIGDRNTFRESVTVHRGTVQGNGVTQIGNDNLFMVNTHIAHDCRIGNRCILANNVTLGGHIVIDDFAIIGGLSAVHQFCVIGAHAMVGGCSGVAQDVPPYVVAQGNHASAYGINIEGLKRRGFSKEILQVIRLCYKILYRSQLSFNEACIQIANLAKLYPEVEQFLKFFKQSTRGIIR